MTTIQLKSDAIRVEIDPGHGADVLSLVDLRTGIDVMFRTPWRSRADALRAGQSPSTTDPTADWLERYRGGWQTLCPVAGAARTVYGAPIGFHGEASRVPWHVDAVDPGSARLHVELFAVPIRIDRVIEVEGSRISILDTLSNVGGSAVAFDYSHHPALGGEFLDGPCVIETGATRFVSDPDGEQVGRVSVAVDWPNVVGVDGAEVDLSEVPGPESHREAFGWLQDFTEYFATVVNPALGLGVRLDWDGTVMPYAWVWQELNETATFPWYRRARAVAIEPASVQTSGADRTSTLRLDAGATVQVCISITIEDRRA